MSAAISDFARRVYAPSSRFSRTVMRGNTWRPSGEWLIPARTISLGASRVMSRPANRMVPDAGRIRPLIARSVVVLPAPFAPISVTISPSSTVSDTSCSAVMRP